MSKQLPRIIISAMARNHVIGTRDGMPWSIAEEYQQYLGFVSNKTVIMGRTSWKIFGPDLKTTNNIVVSRSLEANDEFDVARSLTEALEKAEKYEKEIFIAGGASIYSQAIEHEVVDYMYLSYIKGDFDGIAYFPEFDADNWLVEERVDHERFEFVKYARKSA